ncbi:hypothetical protein ACXH7K_001756 [Klebsiella variicola]
MTSKFNIDNRELLQKISCGEAIVGIDFGNLIVRELAAFRLAAMDSEPVAFTEKHEISNMHATGLYLRAWPADRVQNAVEGYTLPLYRHAQPAPVVPEKCPAEIRDLISSHTDALFNDDDAQEIWSACRSAMLQASPVCTCPSGDGSLRWPCPVHPGNSPAISDSARDALEKALAAMEFMGDTLNNLDAVCTEDVELVAPAFDAVRSVLAAALQEGK